MKVINDAEAEQFRLRHPNMRRGIEVLTKSIQVLRPEERSLAARFDGMTHEEILALPVGNILPEWGFWVCAVFKISTIGQLLELGWPPILASKGIGRRTLWVFRDALNMVGLEWPHLTVDGHRHPARPK